MATRLTLFTVLLFLLFRQSDTKGHLEKRRRTKQNNHHYLLFLFVNLNFFFLIDVSCWIWHFVCIMLNKYRKSGREELRCLGETNEEMFCQTRRLGSLSAPRLTCLSEEWLTPSDMEQSIQAGRHTHTHLKTVLEWNKMLSIVSLEQWCDFKLCVIFHWTVKHLRVSWAQGLTKLPVRDSYKLSRNSEVKRNGGEMEADGRKEPVCSFSLSGQLWAF